ncbi:uncharacterized protein LOC129774087 isoform X2 [Toxorhynchites rutilus septentrionalis]|uniref:uncharacterized protein LOC129774087 isoform X2 n=1 Tax=Toxorhynchites rutilus septentrionalis TaxID=329112 RepID=UPI00247A4904|nr:uncharacterized protein LOC129774087 isoform X2 [Toxorhynchites rutilus septentrionalis]
MSRSSNGIRSGRILRMTSWSAHGTSLLAPRVNFRNATYNSRMETNITRTKADVSLVADKHYESNNCIAICSNTEKPQITPMDLVDNKLREWDFPIESESSEESLMSAISAVQDSEESDGTTDDESSDSSTDIENAAVGIESDDEYIVFESGEESQKDDDGSLQILSRTRVGNGSSVDEFSNNEVRDHRCLPGASDQRRKVSFSMKHEVHIIRTWDFAYRQARIGDKWMMAARDRDRFRRRIDEIGKILKPALEKDLRLKIYRSRFEDGK